MARIFFFHWHPDEAATLAAALRQIGHAVVVEAQDGERGASAVLAALRDGSAIDAVLVSLAHLPAHGRITATYLRSTRLGRGLPVLFVGGTERATVRALRAVPDAVACEWDDLPALLARMGQPAVVA